MKKIIINNQNLNSKIFIEKNSIKKFLKLEFKKNNKIFIIIDKKVYSSCKFLFKKRNNFFIIKIASNEKIKSFNYYKKINNYLLKNNINRSSTLVAIGGGTIGDLCGFIASTILRGVRFVSIPTTLLSQVDSSIGGKNGINTSYGKNLIGTFYHPNLVIIDPVILKSLSIKQMKSGYAEILKYALIKDNKFYRWLKNNYLKILTKKDSFLIQSIEKSIRIKLKYINLDEKEKLINSSSRAMLNFGHTFGHALEAMNNYKSNLTHGEAVSIGMVTAARISYKLKDITELELNDIINHIKMVGLPYFSKNIQNKKIYKLISLDKKNTQSSINLILLKKIGSAYYKRGLKINSLINLTK